MFHFWKHWTKVFISSPVKKKKHSRERPFSPLHLCQSFVGTSENPSHEELLHWFVTWGWVQLACSATGDAIDNPVVKCLRTSTLKAMSECKLLLLFWLFSLPKEPHYCLIPHVSSSQPCLTFNPAKSHHNLQVCPPTLHSSSLPTCILFSPSLEYPHSVHTPQWL